MLILASNSPRRKELLSMLGYEFVVKASDCDETTNITDPSELVKELSLRKAKAIDFCNNDTVIGSDTVVAIDGKILGKPIDEDDAAKMLRTLSGKTHTVYTGVTVLQDSTIITEVISCDVTFKEMTETVLKPKGRHDPAIVHRARIVQDAVSAITLCDMLALRFGTDWLK
jgi:septum formation protein